MKKTAVMKDVYGQTLVELGGKHKNLVVLDADLSAANRTSLFAEKFPDRFFNVGIAEANMIGLAAGFATTGLVPIAHSITPFATGRPFGQIRQSVAYSRMNVKIVGGFAGFTAAEDGASHQSVIDIAIMRALPNMTVLVPADANEVRKATVAMVKYEGPVYMRVCNGPTPLVYSNDYQFEIGKAIVLKEGQDLSFVATGTMVAAAIEAAKILSEKNISARVINIHTIKPIDKETVLKAASETKAIIVAEEHSIIGGLGSAVAEILSESSINVKMIRVGIKDVFGESGTFSELMAYHKLTADNLVKVGQKILLRKNY
jgi:transketolase